MWTNVDEQARLWRRIELIQDGQTTFAHLWSSCGGDDCDGGIVSAAALSLPLRFTFSDRIADRFLEIRYSTIRNALTVVTNTRYRDMSRPDLRHTDTFRRVSIGSAIESPSRLRQLMFPPQQLPADCSLVQSPSARLEGHRIRTGLWQE